jgi:lysine 2,3-aminomutase
MHTLDIYDEEEKPPSEELEPPGTRSGGILTTSKQSRSAVLSGERKAAGAATSERRTRRAAGCVISPRSDAFRRRFFPAATEADWNDWHWQKRNSIQSMDRLAEILGLGPEVEDPAETFLPGLPFRITPYYASLLERDDASHTLRRSVVPDAAELSFCPGELADPLHEDHTSPVAGIVHRYPDRVLFLVTPHCFTYCRYCTRSRLVGKKGGAENAFAAWGEAIDYIQRTPQVRDVLLSGGDPLMLPDNRLEWLLSHLRAIPHVEMLRIGTKAPAVLPQRITPALLTVLKRYQPLYLSLHFTHPAELTPEVAQACERLADAGFPLGSQTVLLRGINDDTELLKRLFQGLLKIRVRPYYLYQCDPVAGTSHLRTSVEKGLEIIRGLRGHTSGYAVPTYVIDAPGGGGKIPIQPDYLYGRDGNNLLLKNYRGDSYTYPDNSGDCS